MGKPLTDSDLVFAHLDGRPLDPGVVTHTFRKIAAKIGLPRLRFHDLRHAHATLKLKAGAHPKIVQERLGHGSISVTLDLYSHVVSGLQESAARRLEEILDMQALKVLVDPEADVGKMSAEHSQLDSEAQRTQTSNQLIKSQLLFLLG